MKEALLIIEAPFQTTTVYGSTFFLSQPAKDSLGHKGFLTAPDNNNDKIIKNLGLVN